MHMLSMAALFFLSIHLLVAGTRQRDRIVSLIGERTYMALFSLMSLGGIIWLVMSYNAAAAVGTPVLWDLGPGVRHAGIILVAVAFFFVVSGLLTANPTSVGMEKVAGQPDAVTGILRLTRHPFLWGVALWSAFHLAANGDEASVVFFGTFFVLAILGTFSIDAKRQRKLGDAWNAFATATSNFPFVALLTGRNRFRAAELLTWRQLIAVAVFVLVLFVHARAFGASPFPGGWVPF